MVPPDTLEPTSSGTARKLIAKQVKSASTSFYWAMRLLPRAKREAIFALYAFCREVDDIADNEHISREDRCVGLDRWRVEIDQLFIGEPSNHVACALVAAVADFKLQKQDFVAVIDGMIMDTEAPICAPRREIFDLYCDRVACAVGRLCVRIFGQADELGQILAHTQGRALQMTNILRDVHEDARRGRLYLPAEILENKGILVTVPAEVVRHPAYPEAWRAFASETAGWYLKAQTAMAACNPRNIKPARIMLEVYKNNFEQMCRFSNRQIADPSVSMRLTGKGAKLLIALRHGIF